MTNSDRNRTSPIEVHSARLHNYHLQVQTTVVRYALPATNLFFLYRALTGPCWQNTTIFLSFLLVTLCWLLGLKATKQGKITLSVHLFTIPLIAYEFVNMSVLEHISAISLAADLVVISYASMFGRRFLFYTGGATFVTFVSSEILKHLDLFQPLSLGSGDRLIYQTVFACIVIPLAVWILLRTQLMQKSLFEGVERLNSEQQEIITAAEDIGKMLETVTEEMRTSIDSVAAQISEQAAAIGQIDTIMARVRRIAGDTATTAQDTTKVAGKVRAESLRGREQLKSMEEGFYRVVEINNTAKQVFADLASQVERIEDVLATNRGVAAQIKILAINAGIQAAKAGEFGTGFRVVATELKGMISRTDESLSHSRVLLEEIRNQAKESAQTIQKSGELLHEQLAELSSTSMLIEVLADAFVNAAERIDTIADAAREQQTRLDEVGTGIGNIDFAANELTNSASALRDSVEKMVHSQHALSEVLSSHSSKFMAYKERSETKN